MERFAGFSKGQLQVSRIAGLTEDEINAMSENLQDMPDESLTSWELLIKHKNRPELKKKIENWLKSVGLGSPRVRGPEIGHQGEMLTN